MLNALFTGCAGVAIVFTLFILWVLSLRRIVPTTEVHTVQRANSTISYGKASGEGKGNAYYEFPSWIPIVGVTVTKLPTGIFARDLNAYDAYDKERLPFVVDVKAFFRIVDFNKAATRVSSIKELEEQLDGIVQGAVRSLLAKENLESIMSERNKYGSSFTSEVTPQLKEWGIETVKNIELMDIRDADGSIVIKQIMAKKKSQIEMESRTMVAENDKKANQAEIESKQEIALAQQDAERKVGLRKAEVNQEVGIANEKQMQQVQEQAKVTAEKEMEVKRVRDVQSAEIEKQAATVKAEQDKAIIEVNAKASVTKAEADKNVKILEATASKEQTVLTAEADKTKLELKADADLKIATNEAKGIELKGKATAEAEKLAKVATVQDKITLAKEIGSNKEYQSFLITTKQIEVMGEVGVAQANNLRNAEIKIFANSGSVSEGVNSSTGIFNSGNALNIASMLEAFKSTPIGADIADKILGTGNAVKALETVSQMSDKSVENVTGKSTKKED